MLKMKILYDHQIFSHQKFGGVSRYFTNLIKMGNKDNNIELKLGLITSRNEYMPRPLDFISKRLGKKSYKRIISINKAASKRLLNDFNFDIFHPTYYHPYFLPHLKNKPFVLTIFDMMPELFPEFYPSNFSDISRKKILVSKADRIIAISHQTKKDLVRLLSVDEEKISVVHLNSDLTFNTKKTSNYRIPKNYLLYVGTRNFYKNFPLFLKALQPILDNDIKLVLAGGGELDKNEKQLLKELNIHSKTIHFNKLNNDLLSTLYKNAKAFIFPSLYEGFGIPILEAFSCNCPVILSDIEVFKEIAQDGANYFDPRSEESIRESIKITLGNKEFREKKVESGKKILEKYSPEKTYNDTIEVYKTLM